MECASVCVMGCAIGSPVVYSGSIPESTTGSNVKSTTNVLVESTMGPLVESTILSIVVSPREVSVVASTIIPHWTSHSFTHRYTTGSIAGSTLSLQWIAQ
eukprot:1473413-Lingulodinium_polyedra.AAC.1